MQCNPFWEFMHYEFELGHNVTEVIKNIYCVKCEDVVDYSTTTRCFKKLWSSYKILRQSQLGLRLCSKP